MALGMRLPEEERMEWSFETLVDFFRRGQAVATVSLLREVYLISHTHYMKEAVGRLGREGAVLDFFQRCALQTWNLPPVARRQDLWLAVVGLHKEAARALVDVGNSNLRPAP